MRRNIFFLALILFDLTLIAQRGDNHFAVWGGVNASNFSKMQGTHYGYSLFAGTRSYINAIPDFMIGYQQKGGYNTLPVITPAGTGSETFAVDLSYLTLALPLKYNIHFGTNGHMRLLGGPYVDYLVSMKSHAMWANDTRTISSFSKFGGGLMYGFDANLFTGEHLALALGIYGQNSFTKAGDVQGTAFRNNTYMALLTIAFSPR